MTPPTPSEEPVVNGQLNATRDKLRAIFVLLGIQASVEVDTSGPRHTLVVCPRFSGATGDTADLPRKVREANEQSATSAGLRGGLR
jgi:hypothetical protein